MLDQKGCGAGDAQLEHAGLAGLALGQFLGAGDAGQGLKVSLALPAQPSVG